MCESERVWERRGTSSQRGCKKSKKKQEQGEIVQKKDLLFASFRHFSCERRTGEHAHFHKSSPGVNGANLMSSCEL